MCLENICWNKKVSCCTEYLMFFVKKNVEVDISSQERLAPKVLALHKLIHYNLFLSECDGLASQL